MKNQDEINLVKFFTRNKGLTRVQKARFESLLARDCSEFRSSTSSKNKAKNSQEFENERTKFSPLTTADFLSLFGSPSGLKFLTHDFDPNSNMSIPKLLEQVNNITTEWKDKIPDSLCSLMTSFIQIGNWIDYNGGKQKLFLEGEDILKWCSENPHSHPITSKYETVIQTFRQTVRISKPKLEDRISEIIANPKFENLKISHCDLDKADFYTNVYILRCIIIAILEDIHQRESDAEISIAYEREIFESYRKCSIKITHHNSEANSFEEVQNKLITKGGALYKIFQLCLGYCDWSIEANFEGKLKRWRIINNSKQKDIEILTNTNNSDFTHTITFYKKLY